MQLEWKDLEFGWTAKGTKYSYDIIYEFGTDGLCATIISKRNWFFSFRTIKTFSGITETEAKAAAQDWENEHNTKELK
jgi:hypothetical protein